MGLKRVKKIFFFAYAVFLKQRENFINGKALRDGDTNRAALGTLVIGKRIA